MLRAGTELCDEGGWHDTPVPVHPGTQEYLYGEQVLTLDVKSSGSHSKNTN